MNKIKIAIIGAGWWACEAHIPALKQHPHAELVALHKRDIKKAEETARHYGVKYGLNDVDEILALPELKGVVIASTPNMHYSHAKSALQRGLHVLIEKPMTITASESKELLELANANDLHFVISCPWHYTRHTVESKQLLQSGTLGKIKMISILMTNFSNGLYKGKEWSKAAANASKQHVSDPYQTPGISSYSDPKVAGGGHIYTQSSHILAYLGFITGSLPKEVFARFDNDGLPVDVYNTLSIMMNDGVLVSVATNGATMKTERNFEVRVYGTEGMLFQELWKGTLEHHNADGEVIKHPDLTEDEIYPIDAPANNFVDLIIGKANNGSPASLGHIAMQAIDAACLSAKFSKNIVIDNSI